MKAKKFLLTLAVLFQLFVAHSVLAGPGAVDTFFSPSFNGAVYSVIAQPDGKILVAGAYTVVNNFFRDSGISRLYPDGSLDLTFSNTINGTIYTTLRQPDGRVLIGGAFTTVSNPARYSVARLNSDGSIDGSFNTSNTLNGTVYSLCVQSDGKILAGGSFNFGPGTTKPGSIRYSLMRLYPDGSLDTNFNAGFNTAAATVYSIAQQSDGKILIGGSFASFDLYGVTRVDVARLETDGTPDISYPTILTQNGIVHSVYLQNDGRSVWAGEFSVLLNSQRGRIGRLNADGSMDTSSFTSTGANNSILATAQDTNNGYIYIGGLFTSYNGSSRGGVARLFSDGTSDSTYASTTNFPQSTKINCLAVQPDGRLLVGGGFNSFNGVPRTNLVRLYSDLYPAEIVTQPKSRNAVVGSNVTFSVDLSNPTAANYQWRKDGVSIPGATFAQYTIFNSQLADSGNYSVAVNTGAGGTTSSNALLQVGIPVTITQNPVAQTVTQGQTATFTVGATGSPLFYQWVFSGRALTNATNATLIITNCSFANAGLYNAFVSNFLGTNDAPPALLTVVAPIGITSQPHDQSGIVGGSASFSVSLNTSPVTYQWFKGTNPIPGATAGIFPLINLTLSDAAAYHVVVSNYTGAVTSSNATLTVGIAPGTLQYQFINSNKTFALQMNGTPGFNYVLQSTTNLTSPVAWNAVITNTTDTNGLWSYLDTNLVTTPARYYRVSSP